MQRKTLLYIILSITLLASKAMAAENMLPPLQLSFGVYQSDKATIMYQKLRPVLEHLQQDMGKELARPVYISLIIFKTYAEANTALVDGSVDFVRFGPASYAIAKASNEKIQLVVMEHKKGKKQFKGLVVVQADSPIKTLADIKGQRFAFGDQNSTIGRYLIQAELIKAGIFAKDLKSYAYLKRHDRVFKAVKLGDYDAGSIKEGTFHRYNKNNDLKVIHTFNNVTKPWIARADLAPKTVAAIRQSLLTLRDEKILAALKVSGFLAASDEEYKFVREEMRKASEFTTRE